MPTKKQLAEADRLAREIDWSKFDSMSDEEIRAHWAWDKEMTWPTETELATSISLSPPRAGVRNPRQQNDRCHGRRLN